MKMPANRISRRRRPPFALPRTVDPGRVADVQCPHSGVRRLHGCCATFVPKREACRGSARPTSTGPSRSPTTRQKSGESPPPKNHQAEDPPGTVEACLMRTAGLMVRRAREGERPRSRGFFNFDSRRPRPTTAACSSCHVTRERARSSTSSSCRSSAPRTSAMTKSPANFSTSRCRARESESSPADRRQAHRPGRLRAPARLDRREPVPTGREGRDDEHQVLAAAACPLRES